VLNDGQVTAIDDKIIAMWREHLLRRQPEVHSGRRPTPSARSRDRLQHPAHDHGRQRHPHSHPWRVNMTWDTSDTTAVITGSAAGKVSTRELRGRRQGAGTGCDGGFRGRQRNHRLRPELHEFQRPFRGGALELEIRNNGTIQTIDDKTIHIFDIGFSSVRKSESLVGLGACGHQPDHGREEVIPRSQRGRHPHPDSGRGTVI